MQLSRSLRVSQFAALPFQYCLFVLNISLLLVQSDLHEVSELLPLSELQPAGGQEELHLEHHPMLVGQVVLEPEKEGIGL